MTARTFADEVHGFGHKRLAGLEAYNRVREALADLVDQADAPAAQLTADIRACVISSVFGAPCTDCGATVWPWRGNRVGDTFEGQYACPCGRRFRTKHDIQAVNWPT